MTVKNHPILLSSCLLVGRDAERQALTHLWHSARLVTLVGQSGVGKSALARAAADELAVEFPSRVLYLDAGGITTALGALRLLARTRRTRTLLTDAERGRRGDGESLKSPRPRVPVSPRPDAFFVLLDDLPTRTHGIARGLLQWLVAYPEIHLLVVSRRPLELLGERVMPLAPLAVPPAGDRNRAAPGTATDLFLAGARDACPDVPALDSQTAAALCGALDGLPAALEAAASMVGTLPLSEIARIAREAPLGLSVRGRSLRSHVSATWEDLPAAARDYLSANAVWPAEFGAEAGAELYGGQDAEAITASLLRLGLLRPVRNGSHPYYRMSPLLRAYLQEAGEASAPDRREKFARYLLGRAERLCIAGCGLRMLNYRRTTEATEGHGGHRADGTVGRESCPPLRPDSVASGVGLRGLHDTSEAGPSPQFAIRNEERASMRWAWRWFAGRREGDAVLRFTAALAGPLGRQWGEPAEAYELLQSALACVRIDGAGTSVGRNRLQNLESVLAAVELRLGRLESAEARLRALLDGDVEPGLAARSRLRLGAVLTARGRHAEAIQVRVPAVCHLRAVGDETLLAWALYGLAEDQRRRGEGEAAGAALEESSTLFDRSGCPFGRTALLVSLGMLHAEREEWGEATWHGREARALAESVGDRPGRARALQLLGRVEGRDDPARGMALATEAVALWEEMGRPVDLAAALLDLAGLARAAGEPEERALLHARSALRLARRDGCVALEVGALLSLAETYRRSGRIDRAGDYAAQAHDACERTDDARVHRQCEEWARTGRTVLNRDGQDGQDRRNGSLPETAQGSRLRPLGSVSGVASTVSEGVSTSHPVDPVHPCDFRNATPSIQNGEGPPLMVRLLGSLEVEGPGGVVTPAGLRPKEQRVLARLALEPGRLIPRDELLDLFWSDSAAGAAERSLRTVVSSLRGSLRSVLNGHDLRLITGRLDGYCLEPAAFAVDAARFGDAMRAARAALQRAARAAAPAIHGGRRGRPVSGARHPALEEALAACREAVDLYRGDLLSAFPYDDWCLAIRERMRDDYLDALFQLAGAALAEGSPEAARALGSRMIEVDPTEERAHRLLMRCYARLGRPADALRQFARCRAALHDELGARPSPATLSLLETIRAGAACSDEDSESPRMQAGTGKGI